MLIAGKRMPGGAGLAAVLVRRAASVALDWDVRQKSRFDTVDSAGRALGVVLPRGTVLRDGDVLVADDGSLVRVTASPQPVLRVTVGAGGDPRSLARAAYHLGNRHVPLEVRGEHLQFEPEAGAYDAGAAHGGHGQGHDRAAHGHASHGHASHGQASHDHGSHGPASHDSASHDHDSHGHGPHDHGSHDHGSHDHAARDHDGGPAPVGHGGGHVHGPDCGHDHG